MGNEYDHFEDFLTGDRAVRDGGGILESPGLKDYEGIETKVAAEGAQVVLNCRRCNKKKSVVVEWPELVILGENHPGLPPLLPTGWKFSQKNADAYVALPCNSCGNETGIAIHMTPEEAQGHVRAGVQSGLIHPGAVQAIKQQVAARRGLGSR